MTVIQPNHPFAAFCQHRLELIAMYRRAVFSLLATTAELERYHDLIQSTRLYRTLRPV